MIIEHLINEPIDHFTCHLIQELKYNSLLSARKWKQSDLLPTAENSDVIYDRTNGIVKSSSLWLPGGVYRLLDDKILILFDNSSIIKIKCDEPNVFTLDDSFNRLDPCSFHSIIFSKLKNTCPETVAWDADRIYFGFSKYKYRFYSSNEIERYEHGAIKEVISSEVSSFEFLECPCYSKTALRTSLLSHKRPVQIQDNKSIPEVLVDMDLVKQNLAKLSKGLVINESGVFNVEKFALTSGQFSFLPIFKNFINSNIFGEGLRYVSLKKSLGDQLTSLIKCIALGGEDVDLFILADQDGFEEAIRDSVSAAESNTIKNFVTKWNKACELFWSNLKDNLSDDLLDIDFGQHPSLQLDPDKVLSYDALKATLLENYSDYMIFLACVCADSMNDNELSLAYESIKRVFAEKLAPIEVLHTNPTQFSLGAADVSINSDIQGYFEKTVQRNYACNTTVVIKIPKLISKTGYSSSGVDGATLTEQLSENMRKSGVFEMTTPCVSFAKNKIFVDINLRCTAFNSYCSLEDDNMQLAASRSLVRNLISRFCASNNLTLIEAPELRNKISRGGKVKSAVIALHNDWKNLKYQVGAGDGLRPLESFRNGSRRYWTNAYMYCPSYEFHFRVSADLNLPSISAGKVDEVLSYTNSELQLNHLEAVLETLKRFGLLSQVGTFCINRRAAISPISLAKFFSVTTGSNEDIDSIVSLLRSYETDGLSASVVEEVTNVLTQDSTQPIVGYIKGDPISSRLNMMDPFIVGVSKVCF